MLCGIRFFNVLYFLEVRLDILVVRMGLSLNIKEVHMYIKKKLFLVNGFITNPYYLVRVGDVVQKLRIVDSSLKKKRVFSIK